MPDSIPELILWIGGVGSAGLAAGALIIGPTVHRFRMRRLRRRLEECLYVPESPELPELCDLLSQVPPRPGRDL